MILHVDSDKFLTDCIRLLKKSGDVKSDLYIMGHNASDCLVYEDELIRIAMSSDGMWGEIERKSNQNLFFMKCKGEIIRFQGEFIYLDEHVTKLLKE